MPQGMEGIIAHAAVQQDAFEVLVHGAPIKRLSKIVREHQMEAVVPKCASCQLLLILLCPLMPQDPHGVLREDHLALLAFLGRREEVAEIALDLLLMQLLADFNAAADPEALERMAALQPIDREAMKDAKSSIPAPIPMPMNREQRRAARRAKA